MTATGVVINGEIGDSVAWSKKIAPLQFIATVQELIAIILCLCYVFVEDLMLVLKKDFQFFLWVGVLYFPYLLFYKFVANPYLVRH